jgi:hypothetical protein
MQSVDCSHDPPAPAGAWGELQATNTAAVAAADPRYAPNARKLFTLPVYRDWELKRG